MKSMDRRLKHLEASCRIHEPGLSVIIRTGVPRASDGPEGSGTICATIVSGANKGMWLTRGDSEPEAAFLERVDQAERGSPAKDDYGKKTPILNGPSFR